MKPNSHWHGSSELQSFVIRELRFIKKDDVPRVCSRGKRYVYTTLYLILATNLYDCCYWMELMPQSCKLGLYVSGAFSVKDWCPSYNLMFLLEHLTPAIGSRLCSNGPP